MKWFLSWLFRKRKNQRVQTFNHIVEHGISSGFVRNPTVTTGTGSKTHTYTYPIKNNFSWNMPLLPADKLLNLAAEKIDEKSISDYEFREWMRDNLDTCSYITEPGGECYRKTEEIQYISVLDAMVLNDGEIQK